MVVLLVVLALAVIAMLGVAIVLIIRLIKMGSLMRSDRMPMQGKIAFWVAVIYGAPAVPDRGAADQSALLS
jgi:hypothetical protein